MQYELWLRQIRDDSIITLVKKICIDIMAMIKVFGTVFLSAFLSIWRHLVTMGIPKNNSEFCKKFCWNVASSPDTKHSKWHPIKNLLAQMVNSTLNVSNTS